MNIDNEVLCENMRINTLSEIVIKEYFCIIGVPYVLH